MTMNSSTVNDPAAADISAAADDPVAVHDPVAVILTDGDIADGQRGVTDRCPVALAVRRATGIKAVSIRSTQGVLYGTEYWSFELPAAAREFIAAYDAGQPVRPLVFDIRPRPYRVPMPWNEWREDVPGENEDVPSEATA